MSEESDENAICIASDDDMSKEYSLKRKDNCGKRKPARAEGCKAIA
jgi:hypothetical protein